MEDLEVVGTSDSDALLPSGDTGQAVTSGEGTPSKTTETPKVSDPGPVNLFKDPNFKKIQAERDQREAAMLKRLAELEKATEDTKLAGMNEGQRNAYLVQKFKADAESTRKQLEDYAQAQEKAADVERLHAEYGAPKELLEEAATFKGAEKIAIAWKAQLESAARNREEKVKRNAPDLGGTGATATRSKEQKTSAAAAAATDMPSYIKALREAVN